MANGILDALSKHSMFSETLDTLNRDPSTAHQMKGFDFAQNFPGAVPGGVYTPTSFLGPMLSKGYQYGQEIGNALLDGPGNYTVGQAIKNAGIQSDANIQGMLGRGFDMDTYNQNVKDFNIADVNFANSFGLDNLFGSSAMADELDEPIDVENFLETNRLKSTPDVVDVNRIPGRIQEAVEPQYRIRDQLSRDFLQGGLFRDAKQGLGQTKDALVEDFGQLREGLGSIKDSGMNLFGLAKDKGIDFGKMIGRGIGNAIFPGLGFLIGNVKESPTDKVGLASFGRGYDPYGYKGQLTSGTLGARQDPFGRNIVSAFSNYEQNRINELKNLTQLQNQGLLNNKFKQDKLEFAQNYLEKVKQEREQRQREAARRNFANVYAEADKRGFTGPGGGFDTSAGDKAGTSLGSGQFSPSSSRGRSGY